MTTLAAATLPAPAEPATTGRATAAEALQAARGRAVRPVAEWVPLDRLHGRRLAEPVRAGADLPGRAGAAMDGWAVRAADAGGPLAVVGESAAGHPAPCALGAGQACRISTGGALPEGADAVVRREHGRESDGTLRAAQAPGRGADVRPRGDDACAGQELLPTGAVVGAHEVAVVAAAGHDGAACHARPLVALLTTGDELVPPGAHAGDGAVVDANLAGLRAQVLAAGGAVIATAHARDSIPATVAALAQLLAAGPDLLVTAGGVSVGDHDHVGPALERLGARWLLRGVGMRPGGPVGIAVRDRTTVLALPGTPAAAAVCFHVLGRALLGDRDDWSRSAPLRAPLSRHARATTLVRCTEGPGGLTPLPSQGSAQVSSLAGARVLAWIAPGPGPLPAGEAVPVSALP